MGSFWTYISTCSEKKLKLELNFVIFFSQGHPQPNVLKGQEFLRYGLHKNILSKGQNTKVGVKGLNQICKCFFSKEKCSLVRKEFAHALQKSSKILMCFFTSHEKYIQDASNLVAAFSRFFFNRGLILFLMLLLYYFFFQCLYSFLLFHTCWTNKTDEPIQENFFFQ